MGLTYVKALYKYTRNFSVVD